MKTTQVTCDACGKDLATTTNCEDYRIVLASERIPCAGGVVTAMAAYPDFPEAKHFCGHRCFESWCKGYLNPAVTPTMEGGEAVFQEPVTR